MGASVGIEVEGATVSGAGTGTVGQVPMDADDKDVGVTNGGGSVAPQ